MAEPLKPHRGRPDCDGCEGNGYVEAVVIDNLIDRRECDFCDGTGKTEWPPFEHSATDACDRCDEAGDARKKPVDDTRGCQALCAACYQRMHDEVCGCGAKVATRAQLSEQKRFEARLAVLEHATSLLADRGAGVIPRDGQDRVFDALEGLGLIFYAGFGADLDAPDDYRHHPIYHLTPKGVGFVLEATKAWWEGHRGESCSAARDEEGDLRRLRVAGRKARALARARKEGAR